MKQITILFVAVSLLLSSCTKNYDTVPANSRYLTGNGSNFYMPLSINNSWTYLTSWPVSISTRSTSYYIMNDNGTSCNIWIDTTGAYMMKYNTEPLLPLGVRTTYSGAMPFVYIPASPVTGQTWTTTIMTGMSLTAKVINDNASIATNICGYTGCLEISYTYSYTDINGYSGTVVWVKYFKKGIGQVYATSNVDDTPGASYGLTDFVLN